jgi:hypothetical protein
MSGFGMLFEDPFYDEDGVLMDEDADWQDIKETIKEVVSDQPEACYVMDCDPFNTINS